MDWARLNGILARRDIDGLYVQLKVDRDWLLDQVFDMLLISRTIGVIILEYKASGAVVIRREESRCNVSRLRGKVDPGSCEQSIGTVDTTSCSTEGR